MKSGKRTKKTIIIVCSILVCVSFICLFTVFFQWRFKSSRLLGDMKLTKDLKPAEGVYEELMSRLEDDNAAKYYLKASQSFVSANEFDDLEFHYAIKRNYAGLVDDAEFAQLLDRNQHVLDLVRKGIEQEFCSIPQEHIEEYSYFLADLRRVARLFAFEAALLEKNGEIEQAVDECFDLLRFANDISTTGETIFPTIGRSIEGLFHYIFFSMINYLDSEALCRGLLENLIVMSNERAPLRDSLEISFAASRRNWDKYGARSALYEGSAAFQSSFSGEDMDRKLRKLQGRYKPDSVLEYFSDTCDRAGWYLWFQITKSSRLKEMDRIHGMILQASRDSYHGILSAGIEEKVSNGRITQDWFSPTYRQIQGAAQGEAVGRATIIRLALRIHLLQSGEYPMTLDELELLVPEEFLIDPFSAQRFVYKKTGDGYRFYSFGPDIDDDGCEGLPMSGMPENCDIVFDEFRLIAYVEPAQG